MTTAEKLEAMTDRASFEVLATSVLRRAVPHYASVIHTGINAQGETIVSPLDGLCLIPNSTPPRYIFVQHTTTDRTGLRGKWLSNADSDLNKAVSEAAGVRSAIPNAHVTVILCTNQRVDGSLVKDVSNFSIKSNLAIDIWPQDKIADFLDNTSDGQWLRRVHLGVDAERLSPELLHHLCQKANSELALQTSTGNSGTVLKRPILNTISETLKVAACRLVLLAGPSGFGKSITVSQFLDNETQMGRPALWLPARFLEDGRSLTAAIDAWLRELHGSLEANAGALATGGTLGHQDLTIVIDDINRLRSPIAALNTSLQIAAQHKTDGAEADGDNRTTPQSRGLKIVLPIWPEQIQYIPESMLRSSSVRLNEIGVLSSAEAQTIIRSSAPQLSDLEADGFAARLAYDPFAIGAFVSQVDSRSTREALALLCDDAIGNLIQLRLKQVADRHQMLATEYRRSLADLGSRMILERSMRPTWAEITSWFADQTTITCLRHLILDGHLIRLDTQEYAVCRHDRLLDRILGEGVRQALNGMDTLPPALADPYFARVVGWALSRFAELSGHLESIATASPLAIFEAIRSIGEPLTEHHRQINSKALEWTESHSRNEVDAVIGAISWVLLETDSTFVPALASRLPSNMVLMLAAFRNGSVAEGIRYIKSFSNFDFEPSINNSQRNRIFDHARAKYLPQIDAEIRRPPDGEIQIQDTAAKLALIGHLRIDNADQIINSLWEIDRDQLWGYAMWAACRCSLMDLPATIVPLLNQLEAMPSAPESSVEPSRRFNLIRSLSWSFAKGITGKAAEALISRAQTSDNLKCDLLRLVELVDNPDCIDFIVHNATKGCTTIKWRFFGVGDNPPDQEPMSQAVKERLQRIWEDLDEDIDVRTYAFNVWLTGDGVEKLSIVQAVPNNAPYFVPALQYRLQNADSTAVQSFIDALTTTWPRNSWWRQAYRIWCSELYEEANIALGTLAENLPRDFSGHTNDEYEFEHLLIRIPQIDAESLLAKHWDGLRYSPLMIQAALRVNTTNCLRMADEAIASCPPGTRIFRFAFLHSLTAHRDNPPTAELLDNYIPYLDLMSDDDYKSMAWSIARLDDPDEKIGAWITRNLLPRLNEDDLQTVETSDRFYTSRMDDEAERTQHPPFLQHLFDRKQHGAKTSARILRLIEEWFDSHQTLRGLEVVAECLKFVGTRDSLRILEKHEIEEGDKANRIKRDAQFTVLHRTL